MDFIALAAALHSARGDRSRRLSPETNREADKERDSRKLLSAMLETRFSTAEGPTGGLYDEDDDDEEEEDEEELVCAS